MAGRGMRQCLRDITAYLVLVIAIATLGSLQFGFHLVSPVVTRNNNNNNNNNNNTHTPR